MALEIDPRYDHASVEKKWRERWDELGAFAPEFSQPEPDAESYCIVIPPPNVTGELHVGHALDQTIQDVLTRYNRKKGKRTLWLPGMDHAGIATQVKVEEKLKKEGHDRHELGREKFLDEVWKWKEESGGAITNQQRLMGFSLDWSRERFTMDEGLSHAVLKVFIELYKDGLIYRGTRMVNWDPASRTVLSDLEVEFDENYTGELYDFAYPLSDGSGEIVVSTTRPETMLGDTGIAVNPEDDRYKDLIGKTVQHPFVDREIPIIGDAILVDVEFGTGAVKVTPAHDPNDFEVGQRHKLESINIFDEKAHVNENGGDFQGMERFEARKAIKKALAEAGLERGSKEHKMSVGRSQRSGVIVEPLISTQWFVKIKPLADPAIKAVKDGTIRFVPEQWSRTYFHWMYEIRDWCISRQLWWGHRIPAWYGPDDEIFVAHDEAEALADAEKHYGKKVKLRQDPDVLDTWFSSGLWPFSTLGWPDTEQDLKAFYPTSVLVTGFDIIFFWVARMIMQGLHFMDGKPPFKDVYIHGLMRDENGDKMSKTKGNVVDPLVAVEKHGADAFRFFLMATLSEGKDSLYSPDRLKGYQNFSNKIWNSTRFVLMNLSDDFKPDDKALLKQALEAEDYWILDEFNRLVEEMDRTLGEYKFHLASDAIYSFSWRFFCDWYIEFIKPRLFGKVSEESAEAARQTVFYILRGLIHLLHPFMPFITEEVYALLLNWHKPEHPRDELLTSARLPDQLKLGKKATRPANALRQLQSVITATRTIRAETGIAPDQKLPIVLRTENKDLAEVIDSKAIAIQRLAKIESCEVKSSYKSGQYDAMETFGDGEVFIPLEGVLDIEKEVQRLEGELKKTSKVLNGIQGKLKNEKFLANAPADVVEKEKGKLTELQEKEAAIQNALKRFGK